MAPWNPGRNPFPHQPITRITGFEYLDELKFVRHATVHVDKQPKSLWQLSADFRVRLIVHPAGGEPYPTTIRAPRGLYTDLASVPKAFWWLVGPIGRHLEASIVHDYLYMAWTDFREKATRQDWTFADDVFLAGMKASRVSKNKRETIIKAVHSPIGWRVFRKKSYTLSQRMEEWLPQLARTHSREG